MGRLRQYLANRYSSVEATNAEFESVIRYINSAEKGNLTLGELMDKLFNASGDVAIGVEFRYNPATGLEYRLNSTAAWTLLVSVANLRGPTGSNYGTIETPLFFNRQDVTATAGQTVFPYTIVAEAADVLVWKNGALLASTDYTYNRTTSQVTLGVGALVGNLITLASIRTSPASAYKRVDFTAALNQVTFPFPHVSGDELAVFRNGIYQREGGAYDYIKSWQTGTVTMTVPQSAGALISVLLISSNKSREAPGLMLEDYYTANGSGMIRLDRVSIADGSLSQAWVNGLVTALATKANIYVSSGTPVGTIAQGSLWVNTSYSVPALMFYDGARWLSASPNGMVPLPQTANALQYLRLNSTATALEYAALDLSGLIPTSQRGAANGVAPLDSGGLLPASVIPSWASRAPIIGRVGGSITNGTYIIGVIEDEHIFDGLTAVLGVGTCTLQLQVGGINVGSTLAVTNAVQKLVITPTTKSGNTAPLTVSLIVTGATGATDLGFNVGSIIDAA